MQVKELSSRSSDVAALQIHVDEAGDGEPIVVLHRSSGPLWAPFHDQLAASFHVVAPHMAGYGRSTRPDDARSPRDLAIVNIQLLDALELDAVHLVGVGFGGWVAAEMATMDQRRLRTLTLVGPAGVKPRDGFIHDPMMEGWIDYEKVAFGSEAAFLDAFGAAPTPELVELWDRSREMTARLTWRPWMWSVSLPFLLRGVATPSLVVWGEQDHVIPRDCVEQYVSLLANAHLHVVAGSGHVVHLERPEELTAALVAHATESR
jgi:pimeloyl-ACP methyl ester carboxylesterase